MWTKDFLLLVQGQAVSCFGSTLYSVVTSLWVYEMTGSTAIMGFVYSAANFARLAVFPVAGVITDHYSRRNLVILCDAVCGLSMLGVAAAAAKGGKGAVWALVCYSAVSGACYGVFTSSINTLMLSITKRKHYVQANSIYNGIEYGVDMIGQGIAGTLYLLIGAPALFFANGITFLFSAGTEVFISKDPKPEPSERKPFLREALEGIRYIFSGQGLRIVLLLAFLINFSFGILRVVLVPWMVSFGEECYGLLGSVQSAGVVIGTVFLSVKKIAEEKRHRVYYWSQILFPACIAVSAWMPNFFAIAILFCLAYINQYIFNTLQRSAVILSAPDEIRGKVICAVQALSMGFSAIGNLAGGVVCQWVSPRRLVCGLMVFLVLDILLFAGKESVKALFELE